jgi:ribosomal protein S27AE
LKKCYCPRCSQEGTAAEVKQLTRSGFITRLACGSCGSLDVRVWDLPDEAPVTSETAPGGRKKVAEEIMPDRPEFFEVREVLERLCEDVEGGSPEVIDELIDSALEELSAYLK